MSTEYKRTAVGLVPVAWAVEPLGNYVHITSGASPSLFVFGDGDLPYFKVEQLSNSDKYLTRNSTPYHFRSGATVPSQSIVFAKRGAAIALNKVRIFSDAAFMDTNLMSLTPSAGLESEYLYYALGYIGLWRFADTTSVPQINNKHIKPLLIVLPSVAEQRAIATALSDVDALIAGLERLIAKKRDIKQAAMQQLLTGQTRLPGFSGEWKSARLGNVASLKNGYMFRSETYMPTGEYKVITIANVQDGYMISEGGSTVAAPPIDIQSHQELFIGDILISMTGNVGRVCRVSEEKCLLNQRVGKLVPQKVTHDFLFALLRQSAFIKSMIGVAKGGAQPNLSASDINEHEFFMPTDLREQAAIADILSDMDADLSALESRLAKTRTIKQGMMQELLTGRTRLV